MGTVSFVSCNTDEDSAWDAYKEYRQANLDWLKEMSAKTNADGTPYYKTVVPSWNPSAYVLIHYFNDRSETEGNLSPMYTSTIDVRYVGTRYNGNVFDESTSSTSPAPGVYRCRLDQVITGWTIALSDMRVQDTAEIIIPYQWAYGSTINATSTDTILPYSALRFNVRLVDIYRYEAP